MGLAITIGAIVALAIALLLWCRAAIAAAERRHADQVRTNNTREALKQLRQDRLDQAAASDGPVVQTPLARRRENSMKAGRYTPKTVATPSARRATSSSAASTRYDASPSWSDYGTSASGSYQSGGSCSSGGGDGGGGGGCD